MLVRFFFEQGSLMSNLTARVDGENFLYLFVILNKLGQKVLQKSKKISFSFIYKILALKPFEFS